MRQRTRYPAAKALFEKAGLQVSRGIYTSPTIKQQYGDKWVVFPADVAPKNLNTSDILDYDSNLTNLYTALENKPDMYKEPLEVWQGRGGTQSKDKEQEFLDAFHGKGSGKGQGSGGGEDQKYATHKEVHEIASEHDVALGKAFNDELDRRDQEREKSQQEAVQSLTERLSRVEASQPQRIELQRPDCDETEEIEGQHKMFPVLLQEIDLGNPVFIAGPAGTGKTTATQKISEILELEYYIQPPVTDKYEILGFVDAGGVYQDTPTYKAVKAASEGKRTLLVLDEIDRSYPGPLTAVHSLVNGIATFPHETLSFDTSNLVLVSTANTWGGGTDSEFVGSNKLDGATLNRYTSRIHWDYDEVFERALTLAKGGTDDTFEECMSIRKNLQEQGIRLAWSPRDTFAYCLRRVKAKKSKKYAAEYSCLQTLDKADRETVCTG